MPRRVVSSRYNTKAPQKDKEENETIDFNDVSAIGPKKFERPAVRNSTPLKAKPLKVQSAKVQPRKAQPLIAQPPQAQPPKAQPSKAQPLRVQAPKDPKNTSRYLQDKAKVDAEKIEKINWERKQKITNLKVLTLKNWIANAPKKLKKQQDADVKEVRELLAQKAKKEALLRQKKGILADAKSKKEGKFEKMGKEELEVLNKLMEEKEEYERFSKQLQPIMDIHRASVILTDPENASAAKQIPILVNDIAKTLVGHNANWEKTPASQTLSDYEEKTAKLASLMCQARKSTKDLNDIKQEILKAKEEADVGELLQQVRANHAPGRDIVAEAFNKMANFDD